MHLLSTELIDTMVIQGMYHAIEWNLSKRGHRHIAINAINEMWNVTQNSVF